MLYARRAYNNIYYYSPLSPHEAPLRARPIIIIDHNNQLRAPVQVPAVWNGPQPVRYLPAEHVWQAGGRRHANKVSAAAHDEFFITKRFNDATNSSSQSLIIIL